MRLVRLLPKLLLVIAAFAVLLFLLSPILAVIGGSFNAAEYFAFPPDSFSLKHYHAAFTNKEHIASLLTSLKIAAYSTIVASLLCVPACIVLAKSTNSAIKKLKNLFMAPIFLPGIVWAVGLMQCMGYIRMQGSMPLLICVHAVMVTPYMIRIVGASMDNFNYTLEDAAASLGASPLNTFFRVTLPNIMSGVVVGMVFSFMISFSEVVITLFVSSSRSTTFPVRVYAALRTEGLDPMVLAYSAIIIVIVLVISIIGEKFAQWSKHFSASF